jgi:hypothetical protein
MFTSALAQAAPAPVARQVGARLDGIAAVVGANAPTAGADVVLRSDVELRARLALAGEGAEGSLPLGPLPQALLDATLQEIVGELLIAREAKRVQIATPSAVDVQRERDRLMRAAGGLARLQALLEALSVEEDELEIVAKRRALVASFLAANLEGVTTVTEAELAQALSSRMADPQGTQQRPRSLEQLRAELTRAAMQRAVQRWVVMLRARIAFRVYNPAQP